MSCRYSQLSRPIVEPVTITAWPQTPSLTVVNPWKEYMGLGHYLVESVWTAFKA